jgi:hypothetical protein
MGSKRLMLGQVRKRSCERHRTDLNLREGGALPFPTSLLASERVAPNNGAKCTREAGNAVAVAHLAAARVPESSAGQSPSL